MIYARLVLHNPWYNNKFKNLFNKAWIVGKYKVLEFEILYADYDILEFSFEWARRLDHAGIELSFGLFGLSFSIRLYDTRHWNEQTQDWENYDDDHTNSKTSSK